MNQYYDEKMRQNRKQNILGVRIDTIDMDYAIKRFGSIKKANNSHYICCVPVHTIMDCYESDETREAVNSSWINTPDGMGVVWILKFLGHQNVSRVYGPDLMIKVCQHYPHRRHLFLGGTEEVLTELKQKLRQLIPDLNIVGSFSPLVSVDNLSISNDLFEKINNCTPDLIWVGLGSPKQELWMQKNIEEFSNVIMVGVGAAFDFLSGNKNQAPLWIQKTGFEWLYRFIQEPKRLWPRYKQYPHFIILVLMQILGIKYYS